MKDLKNVLKSCEEDSKIRISLYLSEEIFNNFKKLCKTHKKSMSKVTEALWNELLKETLK